VYACICWFILGLVGGGVAGLVVGLMAAWMVGSRK
jgi:hypothetical protein